MTMVVFPEYVNAFIGLTTKFLSDFDMSLELKEENVEGQMRSYELVGSPFETTLFVHRTQRSFDYQVGEYRARMLTAAPDSICSFLKDKDAGLNHLATLGAMTSNETGVDVVAQCLILERDISNLAGVAAASMAQSTQALIHSVGSILNPEATDSDAIHELSAWGDLDFEQIQYDYAHLGTGNHSDKEWSIKLNMQHTLTLTAVQNNPFYGGGLLCLLWVPKSEFGEEGQELPIKMLNDVEHLFGEAPTFGGWCDDKDRYVFTSFYPNYLKNLDGITDNLIDWAITRSTVIGDLVELSHEIFSTDEQKAKENVDREESQTHDIKAVVLVDAFNDALDAAQQGDYELAYRLWLPLAEQGNASAQNNIAQMFASGQAVPQDDEVAAKWWRQAADQGLPDAQNNLGFSYAHGLGVKQNWGEAIQWYSRAADQGHALAQANLGSCYGAGEGVPQDWAESTKWYQRSAAQGFALGQSNLGVAYANGQGIQQDFVQAYMWYSLALSSIPSVDRDGRELALTNRNRLAELMTSEEIEEAEKAAYQWKSTEL